MKRVNLSIITIILALCLFLPYYSVLAADNDVVEYDAADFSNVKNRSKQDVIDQYTKAQKAGTTYINYNPASYYLEPASTRAPYSAGVLSPDTLKAMEGMSNFYRWLIGVEPLATNTESNASLQAQALDRNFQFAHDISNSSKPDDMDEDLWAEGFACDHNILAYGSSPAGAVTSWLNEGYVYGDGWKTVGHRTAILTAGYKNIIYGFSGYIAIGKRGSYGNTFTNAFAPFPAAGYMPAELCYADESSWTVELNPDIIKAATPSNVEITVEDLNTGETYICTTANDQAQISASFLNFVQPKISNGYHYTDSYKVTATGLLDVATGNEASITYTVHFFSPKTITALSLANTKYAYTGSEIKPEVTVEGSDSNGPLTEGEDYTITCYNNVEEGTAIVEAAGIGDYCGVVKKTFTIEKDRKEISQCTISLSPVNNYYSGSEITPTVTVNSFGKDLTKDKDYELTYRNNIEPGTASILIQGIGEYSGSVEKAFTIYKATQYLYPKISVSPIEVGGTGQVSVTVKENAELTYTSSDESVIKVDADGKVHALADGYAYIRVYAAETAHYKASSGSVKVTASKDVHTTEDIHVTYSDANNNTATVTRKCSVCGKEETVSFTTISRIKSIWYWKGYSAKSYLDNLQNEGASYQVELAGYLPGDAEDTSIVLESSDPDILEIDGDTIHFVGTGEVTLTIYVKYRPSVKLTTTLTVNHVYDEGTVTKEATCSEKGEKVYKCSVCGETKTEELAPDPDHHTGGTYVAKKKDATCGEDGYTGDICCKGCDAVFESGTVIPATGNHTFDKGTITTQPSCTKEGVKTYTCSVCGNTRTESVAVLGHDLDSHEATEATCVEAGNSAYWSCKRCGKYFSDEAGKNEIPEDSWIIKAKGHDYDEGKVIKEPTCTEEGTKTYTCKSCGATRTEAVAALDHNLEAHKAVEATCTETGNSAYWNCERCGKYFSDEAGKNEIAKDSWIIKAKGHDYDEGKVTKESTCTEEGTKTYTCKSCGATRTEAIAALDHDLEAHKAVEATCTETGNSPYWSCERCCKYYSDEAGKDEIPEDSWIIKAKGHDYDEGKVTKEPTCIEEGVKTYTCKTCGATRTEAIATLDHDLEAHKAVEATCTEAGNSPYWNCENCGKYFSDEAGKNEITKDSWIIKAKGHEYDEGKVTKEATCTEEGEKICTCKTCGDTRTEVIKALGHTIVIDEAVETTTTSTGLTEGSHCSVCGEVIKKQEIIPKKADATTEQQPATEQKTDTEPAVPADPNHPALEEQEQRITNQKGDGDPKGSTYGILSARVNKSSKNSNTLKWNKVKGAAGYIIYGNRCGIKNKFVKLAEVKETRFVHKRLKKGTYYKYLVVAYRKTSASKIVIATSKTMHAATKGGKVGNCKKLKVNKTKVVLKKRKTFKIKAKEIPESKKRKIKRHRKIAFESSNPKIAKVSKTGKIKAIKKGSCKIYVYAQNGVYKIVKVRVK